MYVKLPPKIQIRKLQCWLRTICEIIMRTGLMIHTNPEKNQYVCFDYLWFTIDLSPFLQYIFRN